MSSRIFKFHDHLGNGSERMGPVAGPPIQHQALQSILDGRGLPGHAQAGTSGDYSQRSGRTGWARHLVMASTSAAADCQKMITRLERTLKGGLVYRDLPGTGIMADAVFNGGSTGKKKW